MLELFSKLFLLRLDQFQENYSHQTLSIFNNF